MNNPWIIFLPTKNECFFIPSHVDQVFQQLLSRHTLSKILENDPQLFLNCRNCLLYLRRNDVWNLKQLNCGSQFQMNKSSFLKTESQVDEETMFRGWKMSQHMTTRVWKWASKQRWVASAPDDTHSEAWATMTCKFQGCSCPVVPLGAQKSSRTCNA